MAFLQVLDLVYTQKGFTCIRLHYFCINFAFFLFFRPVDIQTSDAGPGVSSHEQMTQIRMAEYFMISYLDLQSRFHYGPGDSKSHIVEQVMRSLNECLGDGRTIPVSSATFIDDKGQFKMTELSNDELQRMQNEEEAKIAKRCAEQIKKRFQGKKCMGTSIHAFNPIYEQYQNFFFDEMYMAKCASANSVSVLNNCAGQAYFKFVKEFFDVHYLLYDNGFEGIRNGCIAKNGKACTYHLSLENADQLSNGWSGVPLNRVPPPVPDYSEDEFHYVKPVFNTSSGEKDDFCPRKKLEELILSCGQPELVLAADDDDNDGDDDFIVHSVVDKNETLQKIMSKVDDFVAKYTGEDLRNSVTREIRRRYNAKVKAFVTKKTNARAKVAEKAKTYSDFDWEKLVQSNELSNLYVSQLDLYLKKNLNFSKKECEKRGFTKAKKIEAIKQHFYLNIRNEASTDTTNQAQRNKIHVALPNGSSTKLLNNVIDQSVKVPPWGGVFVIPLGGQISLVNTCPIDNFLTIFYVLIKQHQRFAQHLSTSIESYASVLYRIVEMFDNGCFAEGKCEWLKLFPGRFNLEQPGQLNLWGNEDELFASRMISTLESTFTSTCPSKHCPSKVKHVCSQAIRLR